jgi:hypothetical protein
LAGDPASSLAQPSHPATAPPIQSLLHQLARGGRPQSPGIMDQQLSPRVGSQQLRSFVGKRVLFVGKVEQMMGQAATVLSPDGGRVTVNLTSSVDAPHIEVDGTVVDAGTIQESSHIHLCDNFGGWRGARALPAMPACSRLAGGSGVRAAGGRKLCVTLCCAPPPRGPLPPPPPTT